MFPLLLKCQMWGVVLSITNPVVCLSTNGKSSLLHEGAQICTFPHFSLFQIFATKSFFDDEFAFCHFSHSMYNNSYVVISYEIFFCRFFFNKTLIRREKRSFLFFSSKSCESVILGHCPKLSKWQK